MDLQLVKHKARPSRATHTQIGVFGRISHNFNGYMAFATRAQVYEISNDLDRLYRRLSSVKNWVVDTCVGDGLPVTPALKVIIEWADDVARHAYDSMIKWNDITRISNELHMNSQGPGGGELERLARVNVELPRYERWKNMVTELGYTARTIDAQADSEINDLRAAPIAARNAARAAARGGPPMGGSGKPGGNAAVASREQGYEISNGLLRIHQRLKDITTRVTDARDADRLPMSDELKRLLLRAENSARHVDQDKIMFDGITGIDDDAFRVNFPLDQIESWRQSMQGAESNAADIEALTKAEIKRLQEAHGVVQMEGNGKRGRSRGDEWHKGQNRR